MTIKIANIFCVGRNYVNHAKELHHAVPEKPLIFIKPSHAAVFMNNESLSLPGDQGSVHYEAELVVHIGRDYAPGLSADALIDAMALGIDFTLRDVQGGLQEKGYPWLDAKGFLNSAALTGFLPFPGIDVCRNKDFSLQINGKEVQRGNIRSMIFDLDKLISYCTEHYGLKAGDILFTGTPVGVGPVSSGDSLALFWGEEELGKCTIALS
ncbi:MAG: fumarylacetoacetate hydrolase family protein [Sporolactobacillus sp.]